jgi:hypothetical protein
MPSASLSYGPREPKLICLSYPCQSVSLSSSSSSMLGTWKKRAHFNSLSSLRPTKTAAHLPSRQSAALAARSPARTLAHHQTWPRDRDPNPRDEQQRSGKRGHAINLCTEGASVRVQRRVCIPSPSTLLLVLAQTQEWVLPTCTPGCQSDVRMQDCY